MRKLFHKPWKLLTASSLVLALALVVSPLAAQDDLEKPPPIPPAGSTGDVPIPPKVQEEQIEPTVTIREEKDMRIEEYRMGDQVYMVKVTPENGIPYYYVDTDGDGILELDISKQAMNPVLPVHWKVLEWK